MSLPSAIIFPSLMATADTFGLDLLTVYIVPLFRTISAELGAEQPANK